MDNREQSKFAQGRQLIETLENVISTYTSCPNCTRQTNVLKNIIEQFSESSAFGLLFTKLASTQERILFCIADQPIQTAIDDYLEAFIQRSCSCGQKDFNKAINIRDDGNDYYSQGEYLQAFAIYTAGLMFAPEDGPEAAMLYANRSAIYAHFKQYENALVNVDRALKLDYEDKSFVCLLLRKARCLIELGRIQEARDLLENEEARAPVPETPERADWDQLKNRANQASQPRVLKRAVNLAQYQDLTSVANKLKDRSIFHPHEKYLWLSSKVDLRYDEAQGQHYLAAREAIPFAEVVAVEKPLAALALDEVGPRRCHHCHCSLYKSTTLDLPKDAIIAVPVPCTGCSNVLFCSEQCRTEAYQTYHKFECRHLSLLLHSVDKSTHLALRMLYSAGPWEELKTRINSLEEGQSSKKGPLDPFADPNEYSILHQVMPAEKFKAQLRQTITTCLLVKMAEQSEYLLPNSPKDRQLAGCLLQRHLSQLTANQHHLVHMKQFDLNEQQPQNADSFQLASGVASLLGVASCAGNVLLRPFSQANLMQSSVNVYAASRRIPAEIKLVIDLRSYPSDASFRESKCHCPWCSAVDLLPTKCTTCQAIMIKSGAEDEHYKCSSTVCNQQRVGGTVSLQNASNLLSSVQTMVDYFNKREAFFNVQSISTSAADTKLRQFDATLKAVKQIAHPNSEILLVFQNMLLKKHAELALRALTGGNLQMSIYHTATSRTYAQELLTRYEQILDGGGATFCNSLQFGRFLSEAVDNFEPLLKAVGSSSLRGHETVNREIVELRNLQRDLKDRSASIDLKSLVYDLAVTYHQWQPGPSTSGRGSKH